MRAIVRDANGLSILDPVGNTSLADVSVVWMEFVHPPLTEEEEGWLAAGCLDRVDGVLCCNAEKAAAWLVDRQAAKIAAVDSKTAVLIAAGFTYEEKVFSCSDAAQRNALAIDAKLHRGYQGPQGVSLKNGREHVFANSAATTAWLGAYLDHIESILSAGRMIRQAVLNATNITELAEVVDQR